MTKRTAVVALLLTLASCAHYAPNLPLQQHPDRSYGYRFSRFEPAGSDDETFVILTFSGGGTRAAALAYGVMQELARTKIHGGTQSLLDEVDLISSVSGGSFTSMAYALRDKTPFAQFETDFLRQNVQKALVRSALNPLNWLRLLSPHFSRIDLATEYYDQYVFHRATFADLAASPKRPFHVVNATEMDLGSRFEFTQEQFDPICSDLQQMTVGRAVAASSAFPILLTPVTLKNFAGRCEYAEPQWVSSAMEDSSVNPSRFHTALDLRAYLDAKRQYVQLMDGGVSDNIGLRGPMRALSSGDPELSLVRLMNNGRIKRVAVIVVDAGTEGDIKLDAHEALPSIKDVLLTVSGAPMGNYSFDTIEQLRKSIEEWNRDAKTVRQCREMIAETCPNATLPEPDEEITFYRTVITFASLPLSERHGFYEMGTNYGLTNAQIDALLAVGPRLMKESKDFGKLVKELE